jgi:hypothetical protein
MVFIKLLILFLIISSSVFGEIHPWVSIAGIWGQGGAGLSINKKHFINYYYVFDWDDKTIDYQEINLFNRINNFTYGLKFKSQLESIEYAPYAGYFYQYNSKFPITLYNEIEYRINPSFYEEDYIRTRHILAIYATDDFYKKSGVRPFFAFDSLYKWDTLEFEQNRIQIGYFMYVNKMSVRFYFIPWREGATELSWDDQNNFGVSIQYNF